MAIRGNQLMAGTVYSAQLATDAGILLTQLAKGADVILRDGTVAMIADFDAGGFAVKGLAEVTALTPNDYAATVGYVKNRIDAVTAPLQYKGPFDASVGSFPSDVTIGFFYVTTVAGTIGGKVLSIGDMIIANKTVVGATTAADFDEIDNQQVVTSVAGKVGTVTLEVADIVGLQTALDGKAALVHTHAIADVTGLQDALDSKSAVGHVHTISDVTGLQTALDTLQSAIKFVDDETPTGAIDGVNTTFTLAHTPTAGFVLFFNGVRAKASTYSVTGDVLTMVAAPANTPEVDDITVQYRW